MTLHTGLLDFPAGRLGVEIATSPADQALGLAYREGPLPDSHGMLFPGVSSVWMVGMRFPLDLVFLGVEPRGADPHRARAFVVLTWIHYAIPGSRVAHACGGAKAVLEVAGGWTDRYPLKRGQIVPLQG
jgi:uncharacterized membrane protein (UPF0127 family)